MQYKKSPIYRTGNKYKVLNKIIPKLPEDIDTFYDVFGGSGVVGINATANKKVYNEFEINTFKLMEFLKYSDEETFSLCGEFESLYIEYYNKAVDNINNNLTNLDYPYKSEEEEVYYTLRNDYNKTVNDGNPNYLLLYLLTFGSFSNMSGFNLNNEFNIPSRGEFAKFSNKTKHIKELDKIELFNFSYDDFFKKVQICDKDLVFIDPPYLNENYTETNSKAYGSNWNIENEKELISWLEHLNKRGIRFMITNTTKNKGYTNQLLIDFINKLDLNTYPLTNSNNSNGIVNNDYEEVIITNYDVPFEQKSLF